MMAIQETANDPAESKNPLEQSVLIKTFTALGLLQLVALAAYGIIWVNSFGFGTLDWGTLVGSGFFFLVFIPNTIFTLVALDKILNGSQEAREWFVAYGMLIVVHFIFFLIDHFQSQGLSSKEALHLALSDRFIAAYLRVAMLAAAAILLCLPASNPWFRRS